MTDLVKYTNLIADALCYSVNEQADKAITVLLNTRGAIFTAGNGGSSSSASHFTQDLMKACGKKSFCMSDNSAFSLAVANDIAFNRVFSSYLHVNATKDDVLFLISGSGNSENLVAAAFIANAMNMETIALVGMKGGKISEMCKTVIHVNLMDMRMAESAHSIVLHYIIDQIASGYREPVRLF